MKRAWFLAVAVLICAAAPARAQQPPAGSGMGESKAGS